MKRISSLKSVAVIGEKEDEHLPFVERHLSEPLIVIDTVTTTTDEELSFIFYKGKLRSFYKGRSLDSIVGVWTRGRRISQSLNLPVPPAYQGYARNSVLRHEEALYAHLEGARWVSDYYAAQRAGYKPLQLQIAARLGFRVPDTLFTSSAAQAKEFINSYPVTITKPIGIVLPISVKKGSSHRFFATKIYRGEEVSLSGLHLAPAIFQQAIKAAADLRITVIGNKIFSAIIVDKKLDQSSPVRDWRIGYFKGKLHIESYKLPKNIADKCIALVQELGLQFGAIDLVLDKKNDIWFLEINPNGQWAFVEQATGQPMGKAMADLLQTPID